MSRSTSPSSAPWIRSPASAKILLGPFGRTGQEEQRPGQGVRRGLLTGGNEGPEIGFHLDLAHRLSGLGITGREERRKQIARHTSSGDWASFDRRAAMIAFTAWSK